MTAHPFATADERARLAALAREADRPLNHGLRYLHVDGSRNEAAVARAVERRIAHYRMLDAIKERPPSAEVWRRDAIASVEAEVGGEEQIWNVRAGHVAPLSEVEARQLSTDGPLHGGTRRW